MKLSRRKAFGVGVGGAIAGPSLAKQAAQQMMTQGTTADKYIGYEEKQSAYDTPADNSKYLKEKLLQEKNFLQKLANGDISDLYTENLSQTDLLYEEIQDFKSVSRVNKVRIYAEIKRRNFVKNRIEDAKRRLPDLLKRIAGL